MIQSYVSLIITQINETSKKIPKSFIMTFTFISYMSVSHTELWKAKIKSEDEQGEKGYNTLHPCYHFSNDPTSPKCWLLFSNDIKELKPIFYLMEKPCKCTFQFGPYQEMAEGLVLWFARSIVHEN